MIMDIVKDFLYGKNQLINIFKILPPSSGYIGKILKLNIP
jgi:hypothetical protein